jgi:selenocysteine-specific elongation factor
MSSAEKHSSSAPPDTLTRQVFVVEALTGTHPDRLEEEKRRGLPLTLALPFCSKMVLQFGFVDVPGHERFVANMLAGAAE